MLKAIVFDVGGILTRQYLHHVHSKLCKKYNLNPQISQKIRKKHSKKSLVGKISAKEYQLKVAKELGVKDIKSFTKDWKYLLDKELIINKNVERTILKLKKNYILATLTNVTQLMNKGRANKNLYKHFNLNLLSYKERIKKPDIRFYKRLLMKLNFPPNQIVFIDDKKVNLIPAKKLCMKTILFKNNKQLVKDLQKLGVKLK